MADALKTFFSTSLVRRLAADVARADPSFPSVRFIKDACNGLDDLELLARGRHIADTLVKHLPASYPDAIELLLRSLGPVHASDELVGAGMAPFFYLPHTIFVAERGLDHFDVSMRAQYELTKRFTAEASIRPFIARYPERTLEQLRAWAHDPNPHVRRLVSEGTRLRLPWAPRVTWLDAHPDQILGLLELLKDDPAPLVRRSVANNLNDLGKTHPALLMRTCKAWLKGASPERRDLVEHALRSAVKRGSPEALRLLGYGGKPAVAIDDLQITPRRVTIGHRVKIEFRIRSRSRVTQSLLIDLAVHFVKANERTGAKVFKLKRIELPAGTSIEMSRSVSLAVHTTRKPRPGRHAVDVIVNGTVMPAGAFLVVAPTSVNAARKQSGAG